MPRKSKVTPEVIDRAEELALNGFLDKDIQSAIDVSHTLFYGKPELLEAVKRGREKLRLEVSERIRTSGDTQNDLFLARRLNLYQPAFKISTHPKSIKDAKELLGEALKAFAEGQLSESRFKAVESAARTFIAIIETTELEQRIEELEKS